MINFRWRHNVWVALLLCFGLALTACQSAPPQTSLLAGPDPEPVLTLWHALGTEEAEVLQGIADEWASRRQGVRVELAPSASEASLHQKLRAAVQTGTAPALALVRPSDVAAYVEADALRPLDSLMQGDENALPAADLADYFPHFLDDLRYGPDDLLYAWPVHRDQTLLFINRARVEEIGGEFPPRSADDLVKLCAAHREVGGAACFAAFPTGSVAVLWVWSQGGTLLDTTKQHPTFHEEAGQAVMRWLAELRAVGGVYQAPSYEAQVDAFAGGDTLFTFDSTAALSEYEARIGSEWDFALLPPPTGGKPPVTLATGGNAAIFRSDPEMEALAWDFLRFWTGTEANHRWAEALGAYPVRRSALERLLAQWPESSQLRQAAEWLPVARSEPPLAEWTGISEALAQAMIDTINGQQMPDEALAGAARHAQGLLDQ